MHALTLRRSFWRFFSISFKVPSIYCGLAGQIISLATRFVSTKNFLEISVKLKISIKILFKSLQFYLQVPLPATQPQPRRPQRPQLASDLLAPRTFWRWSSHSSWSLPPMLVSHHRNYPNSSNAVIYVRYKVGKKVSELL